MVGFPKVVAMNRRAIGLVVAAVGLGTLAVAWATRGHGAASKVESSVESARRQESSEPGASSAPPAASARAPCDLVTQSGCRAGERCDLTCIDEQTRVGCIPEVGSAELGAPCDAKNACRKGAFCSAQPAGCLAYCTTDADCPAEHSCQLGLATRCGRAVRVALCQRHPTTAR